MFSRVVVFSFIQLTTLMLVGTKSATRTDMLVDVGMVAGCDNLEVPRHVGVLCVFLSSLEQICSFFDVVLCPNPDVSVYYLCIEVEHSFMLATGTFLCYNTCRSLNSNRIIETTVYSLMNYIHCGSTFWLISFCYYRIKVLPLWKAGRGNSVLMQPKVHHQVLMQVTLGSTCITAEKVMVLGNMQSWKTTKVLLGWGEIRHQSAYLKMNAFSAIHLEPVSR